MAINQNHPFEDIDGVKCAIVEKNATQARVDFVKTLLEYNGFKVMVAASPLPKAAAPAALASPDATPPPSPEPAPVLPSTFTIGVTDVSFNVTNAIFGRLLKTRDGRVVTLAYWNEKEKFSDDSVPYFSKG